MLFLYRCGVGEVDEGEDGLLCRGEFAGRLEGAVSVEFSLSRLRNRKRCLSPVMFSNPSICIVPSVPIVSEALISVSEESATESCSLVSSSSASAPSTFELSICCFAEDVCDPEFVSTDSLT